MKCVISYSIYAFVFSLHDIMVNSSPMESKLIKGNDLNGETIKYLVSLRYKGIHFCSGCMISERHILTAAQCIVVIESDKCPDLSVYTALVGKSVHNIERVNYHHTYRRRRSSLLTSFNVGLLLIEGRLFGSDISGWTNISHQHVDHYMEATIAGWQYEEERFMTKVQQTIKVNIVEIKVCEDNLKTSYLKSDKLMCGVPFCENQLVTQEDAGSPVIINNLVVGIVLFVFGGLGTPVVLNRCSGWENYVEEAKEIMYKDNSTCQNNTSRKRKNQI